MICPNCGKETMGIAYCDHCGRKLNPSSVTDNKSESGNSKNNKKGIGKTGVVIIVSIAAFIVVAAIVAVIVVAAKKKKELNPDETASYEDYEGSITEEIIDEDDHFEDPDYWEVDPNVIDMSGWNPGVYGREATLNYGTKYEETIMCYDVPYGVYEAKNNGDSASQLRICMNGITTDGDKEVWADISEIPLEPGESCDITVDEGYFVTADINSQIVLTLKEAYDESQVFGYSKEGSADENGAGNVSGENSDNMDAQGNTFDSGEDSGADAYSQYGDLLDENGNLIENSELDIDLSK